ncbi:uncharacterized protein LOC131667734 [Phymastichus coffea]|uniref:uncharacterized protein LOC131667734 n=1 Tax=Phymastichus coffea TaxID=108790 RepID=UPI00273BAE63|nr:uncharacterized protein LOC131667734 [Phymastichus coffea]
MELLRIGENTRQNAILGSRNLGGRSDSYDDLDFCYGRGHSEDPFEDEFVSSQRRFKDRASAAFDEDLAELRRKRRDVQDRLFDMIDLNAEIEKARNTLEQADNVFGRHALRFDNQGGDVENTSLAQRLERARTLAAMEVPDTKSSNVKWTKLVPVEEGTMPLEATPTQMRRTRLNSIVDGTNNPYIEKLEPRGKRGYSKRKKSVSF